jgi:hypothetical protein
VREILSYAAEHQRSILASSQRADSSVIAWGTSPAGSPPLALRSALASSANEDSVVSEDLIRTGDSALTQPGVPRGLARSGHYRTQLMPVYVTFEATLRRRLPFAYAIPASDTAAVRVLGMHGVRWGALKRAASVAAQLFIVDSVRHAERPFQGHHETSITGRWVDSTVTLSAGTVIVRASQPLGVVAFYLLEPESDDGLVTWNFFDPSIAPGRPFPVIRVPGGVAGLKDAE